MLLAGEFLVFIFVYQDSLCEGEERLIRTSGSPATGQGEQHFSSAGMHREECRIFREILAAKEGKIR